MNSQTFDIINPEKNVGLSNWNIVNDDVMGWNFQILFVGQ